MSHPNENARNQAKAQLGKLIERVLADGKVDPGEREELLKVYKMAILTVNDVREVLSTYIRSLADEVLADGKITDEERSRCRNVVHELKIPPGLLSQKMRAILSV